MEKLGFLAKLKNENKLALVESSEEIKESYIKKSESNISSAKILLTNDKLEEAVALSYYSMYHLITALLFKTGIKSENHTASIRLLKDLFNIDNSEVLFAKKERVDKQYYVNFTITKQEVLDSIKKAEIFNSKMIDFIFRLKNEEVLKAREKFNIITNK